MSDLSQHGEWLSLIDVSGPFLAEPVLKQVFPQGLEQIDPLNRKAVRQAYEEWRDAIDLDDPQLPAFQKAWVELVLKRVLELDEDDQEDILKPRAALSDALTHLIPEHGIALRPDFAVVDEQNDDRPLMLIQVFSHDVNLDEPVKGDGWAASQAERMVALCRANDVRLGLLTNGERWMLIDAPVGAVTTFASWYARLWGQEPITLQAFVNLLGIRRFFVDPSEQLPALFDESLKLQDEVTDALGEQVRRAVEVLIQRLDRADVDLNRELLVGVEPSELYEAALTVMMRIVFLLSAEERGLLLMGDERYEANYAVSTMRMQLRSESEEILERRQDAWSRLLSIFRAVYGGIQHETMRLPALGGSLFDPDLFPFLEGRAKGSNWKTDPAKPLPIDNRTVLLLLDAVQLFQGRTLSYRALDVEQIGYVYEGLLERTVVRATEVTLDLDAAKKSKKPWVTLNELEAAAGEGDKALAVLLEERTGSSTSRVKNYLAKKIDEAAADKLLTACHGDQVQRDRIKPYFHFLRMDRWGYPLVYPEKTFMVTTGADRRETGTHYTPKSFTETIVRETLEPLAYIGPAEGQPRGEWTFRTPAELLDLKICDPAMGSGAFLVQACRWLSERLVEAWNDAEKQGYAITSEGVVVEKRNGYEPLRNDAEERLLTAKRLIAERCLYGVDVNPLAVELAKLSIWLVTLAKGRPFGFLDHNLRNGNSLLGIHDIQQLQYLEMKPGKGSSKKLFASKIDQAVGKAIELRTQLRARTIRDIRDVELMARLDEQARAALELPELVADALIGEVLAANGKSVDVTSLSIAAGEALNGDVNAVNVLRRRTRRNLDADLPDGKPLRRTFHWPLEFPEVFSTGKGGFDAFVGNPPFVGGQLLSGTFGPAYQNYLVNFVSFGERSSVDLVVFFFLHACRMLRPGGCMGLLARRSISEGKNREAGLSQLVANQAIIYRADTNIKWPGKASVVVHHIHLTNGDWGGMRSLNGELVPSISADLTDFEFWEAQKIDANLDRIYQGTILLGEGFKLDDSGAQQLLALDEVYRNVIFPFIGGNEVNKDPEYAPSCWVINFWDWPRERAEKYQEAFKILESKVKPGRLNQKDKGAKENWWLHLRPRPELYHAVGRGNLFLKHPSGWSSEKRTLSRVLVISTGVTKYPAFTFLPGKFIYSNKLCVLADDRYAMFAILSSDVHSVWAWAQKTSLGGDLHSLVYAHGNIFETFTFPDGLLNEGDVELERLGKDLFDRRQAIMGARRKGLTKFYNDFHDQKDQADDMVAMRDLQSKVNELVRDKYGWKEIKLECGFQEVGYLPEGHNTRFTVSEAARREILRRLSKLNRERYEAEHPNGNARVSKKVAAKKVASASEVHFRADGELEQIDLFEASTVKTVAVLDSSNPAEQVYEWIEGKRGSWVAKDAIFAGTGIDGLTLEKAIAELIADEDLEQQGEGDEARYRVKV